MAVPLNILLVEDSPDDADLFVAELRRGGFAPKCKRVETEADYRASLKDGPDLIICDYRLPQFDGLRAMDLLQEQKLDIPFILVSGAVGEEQVVEAMQHGATDYLLKDRIGRLGHAVKRALEQKRLRAERRRMRAQLVLQATALETAANAIAITDRAGTILWVNPAFTTVTGYTSEEVMGKTPRVLKSGQHDRAFYQDLWRTILSGQTWRGQFINRRKDGSLFYDEHTITPVRAEPGDITHFISVMHDVTQRQEADERVRESEERYRLLVEESPDAIGIYQDGKIIFVNSTGVALLGAKTKEELLGRKTGQMLHPEDFPDAMNRIRRRLADETGMYPAEVRYVRLDGTTLPVEVSAVPITFDGKPAVQFIARDITERKRTEKVLRESERRFREMLENLSLIAMTLDKQGRVTFCNDYLLQLTGWKREEVIGADWFAEFIPEANPEVKQTFLETVEAGKIPSHFENPIKTRNGERRDIVWNNTFLRDAAGSIIGTASVGEDVTERKRAEEELRFRNAMLTTQQEVSIDGILVINEDGKVVSCNHRFVEMWGVPPELVEKRHDETLLQFVTNKLADPAAFLHRVRYFYEHRQETSREEVVLKDGRVFDRYSAPMFGAGGHYYGRVWFFRDTTEHKQLEEQLRQAQKMEAIGHLAAGVAHDFNNMLAVIHGNAEMALMFADQPGTAARDCFRQVIAASERAANLTRQLLAFGRKQAMNPQQLNLNEVIGNLTKMLNRVIGENISLQCTYATRLPIVQADVGMMEQVLLNLVVNARDAMPQGGQLLIKTEDLNLDEAYAKGHPEARAGEFIGMSVSDTGTGIAPEYLPRIFEPFYTTKEVGKGTGLGLATVYGIVKQHQGWTEVATQPGEGTTFRILLPAIPAPVTEVMSPPLAPVLRGGTESILLVEDDTAVRLVTRRILEAFDYQVVEATSGRAAMEIWRSRATKIDLLLTDIVMPDGVTGRELAEALFVERPALKVIFMSGYGMEMVGEGTEFIRRTKSHFLQKPFSSRLLIQTVRKCLDEK